MLAAVKRQFSETEPELMDLPNLQEADLRTDLEHLGRINRTFGGKQAVEKMFRLLAPPVARLRLIDIASGYGDHGRNLLEHARRRQMELSVVAVDVQWQTLKIARQATPPGQRMLFVQADARHLPFRSREADLVFCSLALHHFSEPDALSVLKEMARVGKLGTACIDLVRSRLAAFAIWLLTTFLMRDPMVRHDARLSVRRAFTHEELLDLTARAGWPQQLQTRFFWFQQAVRAHFHP